MSTASATASRRPVPSATPVPPVVGKPDPLSPAPPPQTHLTLLTRSALVELALAVLTVAAAFGSFAGFYAPLRWVLPVVAALLIGTGLGLLACWRAWPWWLLAVVAVPVLLVFQLYALYAGSTRFGIPGLDSLRAIADGLVSGWVRMLTVALPADPVGDVMALPTALAFVGGIVTTVLVLRTRTVVGLAVAPLVVFVIGLLMTATRPRFGIAVTAVVLLLLLALLLVRTNRLSAADDGLAEASAGAVGLDLGAQRRHSVAGRVLVGLPAVVLIAILAVAGGARLPIADGQDRTDPRNLVSPDLQVVTGLSPLVEVRPQLSAPTPTTLFEVTVHAPDDVAPNHVRIAALDSFDGALWTQTGEFRQAGSTLPEAGLSIPGAKEVSLDVRVLRSRNAFLPVVGVPVATSGVAAAVEASSGTLVSMAALDGAPVPDLTYQVTAALVPQAGVTDAAVAPNAAVYTALPAAPDWVLPRAQEITEDAVTPWDKLVKLQDFFRGRNYNLKARPGESYGAIERVLSSDEADQFGYAEQYASAFAVLARSLGFPTRIAVGYVLDPKAVTAGTYTVTTDDAHAWPEVLLDNYGWVPFEPTKQNNLALPPPPPPPVIPDNPTDQNLTEVQPDTDATDGGTTAPPTLRERVLTGLWIAVIAVLVVILMLAAIVLIKQLRRTRRRIRGSPARRIAAAWQEVQDRFREAGHSVAPSQTPVELAREIATSKARPTGRPMVDALNELAVIVTAAVCAPEAPTAVAARRAWALHDEVVKALASNRKLITRLLAAIDPRPLLPGASRLRSEHAGATTGRHSKASRKPSVGAGSGSGS